MKHLLLLIPVSAYVGFIACIYTMNDTASVKWGTFAFINLIACGMAMPLWSSLIDN